MSKYLLNGYKNVRLVNEVIEADSIDEAKEKYTEMVIKGEVLIATEDWHSFGSGDCNEPVLLDE